MTVFWPQSLPHYVLRAGYGEQPLMAKASFAADEGPPIERANSTLRMVKLAVSWRMNASQLALFENFVRFDLARGTKPFLMAHPRRRDQAEMRFVGNSPYSVQATAGDHFLVAAELVETGG